MKLSYKKGYGSQYGKMHPHYIEDCPSWRIPGTSWFLQGFSEAGNRTGFLLKGLPRLIALDAGLNTYKTPKIVLITHSHTDHVQSLPAILTHDVVVCGPRTAMQPVQDYVDAYTALEDGDASKRTRFVSPCGLKDLDDVDIRMLPCSHGERDCIAYVFCVKKKQLRDRYRSLPQRELACLAREGVVICDEYTARPLMFMGDTHEKVLQCLSSPIGCIVIECTHLWEKDRTGDHACWENGLDRIVASMPTTTFVLIHWSRRYNDAEIWNYFMNLPKRPKNVVLWPREVGNGPVDFSLL